MNTQAYWLNLTALLLILGYVLCLIKMSLGMVWYKAFIGSFFISFTIGWFYLGMTLWQLK